MFNHDNRVHLSEFAGDAEVVRDAQFFGIGKIASRVPKRAVPIITRRALSEALERESEIVAAICLPEIATDIPDRLGCLITPHPLETAHRIHAELTGRADYYWTDFASQISNSATIHRTAHVAERNVVIGDGVEIDAGAVIAERVILGTRTFIGANTVIGSRAFELATVDGRNVLQAQAGGVRVGDDVIFLSGAMVASSAFATFTEIGDNSAFDNLVHIAHDCVIARGAQVTAGAVLAGRVFLDEQSYVGPNATISNGVDVGSHSTVSIGATAIRNVDSGTKVSGNFAVEHRKFMRHFSELSKQH